MFICIKEWVSANPEWGVRKKSQRSTDSAVTQMLKCAAPSDSSASVLCMLLEWKKAYACLGKACIFNQENNSTSHKSSQLYGY